MKDLFNNKIETTKERTRNVTRPCVRDNNNTQVNVKFKKGNTKIKLVYYAEKLNISLAELCRMIIEDKWLPEIDEKLSASVKDLI